MNSNLGQLHGLILNLSFFFLKKKNYFLSCVTQCLRGSRQTNHQLTRGMAMSLLENYSKHPYYYYYYYYLKSNVIYHLR